MVVVHRAGKGSKMIDDRAFAMSPVKDAQHSSAALTFMK